MSERPNILIITTDQQRWDALSLWGTPGYDTPHLDALAKNGACFDNTYTPSPVCTPSRVSMITGQYSTRHGAYSIGMDPVPALDGPTIGTMLGDCGYATAVIGKTHFVARAIEDQHVAGVALDGPCPDTEFWANFDGPYCGFQHVRHHRHHNAAGKPNAHYRAWLEKKGYELAYIDRLHGDGDLRPKEGCWEGMKPEWTQNAWITEESIDWIDQLDADQPWLIMANYQDPHYPLICPEPYYNNVNMDGVDLGGYVEGDMDGKPPVWQRLLDGKYWSDSDDEHWWDGICVPDSKTYDLRKDTYAAIKAYIGMCKMVDDYIGALIDGLKARGQFENTLIIFTSDHGDLLGQHGLWGKGPPPYEDVQRVPGIMHWPAAQKQALGHVPSHFNHVDIVPTCLEAAGAPRQPFVQGISQVPVLRGETDSVRDWAIVDHIISRNDWHPEVDTVDVHQKTFIQDRWKLVCYSHKDYGELYNLNEDPQQYNNLWSTEVERRGALLHALARADMLRCGEMPIRSGPC